MLGKKVPMLTRLRLDNYRCFDTFDQVLKPDTVPVSSIPSCGSGRVGPAGERSSLRWYSNGRRPPRPRHPMPGRRPQTPAPDRAALVSGTSHRPADLDGQDHPNPRPGALDSITANAFQSPSFLSNDDTWRHRNALRSRTRPDDSLFRWISTPPVARQDQGKGTRQP